MNNSWDNDPATDVWESNKQEVPLHDPPLHASDASIDIPPIKEPAEKPVEEHPNPNLPRFLIRVWQCLASISSFGFQVGATPVN